MKHPFTVFGTYCVVRILVTPAIRNTQYAIRNTFHYRSRYLIPERIFIFNT